MRRAPAHGLLALLAGCAAATPASAPPAARPLRLAFVADYNPPRPRPSESAPGAAWDQALGGLSGLHYSAGDGLLYAISDDRGRFPPRLYAFRVLLSEASLEVRPEAVIPLREAAPSGKLIELDAESISLDARGFWLGTENTDENPTQRWPRLLRVSRSGQLQGELPLPEELLPEEQGTPTRGARSNLAFEALGVSPSGRWLTAVTEAALRQDGPEASFEQGTRARLLRWDLHAHAPPLQLRYLTEPVPRPASGQVRSLLNGVSELVHLDEERLLVLERAYVAPPEGEGVNTIRIFEVHLPVSAPPAAGSTVSKRLVLDLDRILPALQPGLQALDNIEGMTLGPRLPSGARSLLLVSDDNFSATQRTVFIALKLED